MKTATTTAAQLEEGGRRLDASYHASDGIRAHHFIRTWAGQTVRPQAAARGTMRERVSTYSRRRLDTLAEVCVPDGVFIPGRFKRIYVDNPEHGEPWLSPSDMLRADLSGLPLVSRKFTPAMETLRLHQGWILLSRSGTIGNMAYVRSDMDNLVGSDDIIRIVADGDKVPSGYLYAWLSSPPGRALIEQQTYGAVIPHIEAHHVMGLPVPRLDAAIEQRIHNLIHGAMNLRVQACRDLDALVRQVNERILEIPEGYTTRWPNEWSYAVRAVTLQGNHRLDPFHHVGHVVEYHDYLRDGPRLEEIASVQLPGKFKRMYTGRDGVPYLSGVDIYQVRVEPRLWLSRRQPEFPKLLIAKPGTILVQADGQRYGLLGRPAYADDSIIGSAVSNHLVRIRAFNAETSGYVYLFLSTDAGRRELIRQSYGTSIPTIACEAFDDLQIPGAGTDTANQLGKQAIQALELRTRANRLEDQAQVLLVEALTTESAL